MGPQYSFTGTVAEAAEQGRTILFMVSDAAPYMIGQCVQVDGGLSKQFSFLNAGLKKTQEAANAQ